MYASYKVKAIRRRKPTVASKIATAIAARKRKVSRVYARPELKYGDTTINPGAVPAGGYLACINQIAQGTDFQQRIGRLVLAKYVQVDLFLSAPTLAAQVDYGLVALVVDSGPEGALATAADIYSIFALYNGMPFRNLAVNADRFKVLKQSTYMVQNAVNGPNIEWRERWMVRVPLKNSKVRYTGAGGAIPETNAIIMVILSQANAGSVVTSPALTMTTRFAYIDP